MSYHRGAVLINWEFIRNTLVICDITSAEVNTYKKCGGVPVDTFVDIEWTIGREIMTLKIDGNCGTREMIVRTWKRFNKKIFPPRLGMDTAFGSTTTVASLRVTEQ